MIPDDWVVECLGKLLSQKPSYGINAPAVAYDDRLPRYLRITDIAEDGTFSESSAVSVSHPLADRYYLEAGDVVFARTGASTGKSYRYRETDGRLVYAGFLIRVTPDPKRLNSTYLAAHVRTRNFDKYVAEVSQRSGQPGINSKQLSEFELAVPPTVTEQTTIAEALSDVDEAIAAQEAVIAKKRALKTATMQALLSGTRRLPGFSGEWEIKTLAQIGRPLIGLTYSPRDVRETGTLVLRSSNVQSGILAFDDNVFIDPSIAQRCLVEENDILICVRNGSRDLIGKCAKIDRRGKGMAFGAFMSIFRTPDHGYVFHYFQSEAMRRQINEHLGATINQITNASLNGFNVAWPSERKEREGIAEVLSDMDHEIVATTSELSKLRHLKAGMMQQLLTGKIRLV